MPKLPLEQFKGLNLRPGDKVQLTVTAIGNGEVQFEYVDAKDAPAPKASDYTDNAVKPEESNIKQPEKPLTEKDDPEKMDLKELRSRLPVKQEEE